MASVVDATRAGRRRRLRAAARWSGALALVLVVVAVPWARRAGVPAAPGHAVVERVIDGDTIVVRLGGARERVRLLGVDTPESVDTRRPVECYGREAARYTRSLLPTGTAVRLVRDVEARDHFGRLLAYVHRLPSDELVNVRLVADGYAHVDTRPPNVAHAGELVAAAARARQEGRGLWGRC